MYVQRNGLANTRLKYAMKFNSFVRRSATEVNEFFRTSDGQLKVAYAAWDAGEVGIPNPRRLHLGTVSMTPLGLRIS